MHIAYISDKFRKCRNVLLHALIKLLHTLIESSKSVDIGTCLALLDDFEKFVESNYELHMYVSQNLQTDSIWLVGWLVVV